MVVTVDVFQASGHRGIATSEGRAGVGAVDVRCRGSVEDDAVVPLAAATGVFVGRADVGLAARHRACRERSRVPLPDPPLPIASSPDVGHDEDAAAVHSTNGGVHLRPMQHRSDITIAVDELLLNVIGVHYVIGQRG